MTVQTLVSPFPTFIGLDGQPLSNGYVYFGEPGQDPRQYPKDVFYDEGMTVDAPQPLRTTGGFLRRNGGPTNVWADGSCSVLVLDSTNRQVFYVSNWSGTISNVAAAAADAAAPFAQAAEDARNASLTAQGAAEAAQAGSESARDQSYAAGRVKANSAAGQSDGTLVSGDYFYVISAASDEIYELWQKGAVSPTDTGKRTPSTTVISPNAMAAAMGLTDSAGKYVEMVGKSGNRYLAGMTTSVQKAISDLQAYAPSSYQQRDQRIAETSRDADMVTTTVFSFGGGASGTAFAPGIIRTGKTTAWAICENRNLPGGGSGDASLKRVVGRTVTYDKVTRTVSLGSVVEIAAEVPYGLVQTGVGAITSGSGGTDGTFTVAWSGGNFTTNPIATFTVSGGALTAFTVTRAGEYVGASPTLPTPDFSASTGLTGAGVVLTAETSLGCYNGCIGYLKTGAHAGRLLCWYSTLGKFNNTVADFYDYFGPHLRYSDDGGATWSAATDMTATLDAMFSATSGYLIGPGHGIQLASGRIIFPGYRIDSAFVNRTFMVYSDDGGATWSAGPMHQLDSPNEAQIADLRNGELLWVFRATSTGKRFARVDATTLKVLDSGVYAKSTNPTVRMLGESFTIQTGLHQCESDWDTSTRKLVVTHPTHATQRKDMTLLVSYDGGEPWQDSFPYSKVLNPGRGAEYSDLTNFGPNDVFCLYSDGATVSTDTILGSLVSISAYMG